jgi:hypothetical protein
VASRGAPHSLSDSGGVLGNRCLCKKYRHPKSRAASIGAWNQKQPGLDGVLIARHNNKGLIAV